MLRKIVDAGNQVEEEPNRHDGCEAGSDLGGSEWLDQEEQDQDGASDAYDSRYRQIRLDDFEALNCTEDRLCGCQNTVGHDHGYSQHTNKL